MSTKTKSQMHHIISVDDNRVHLKGEWQIKHHTARHVALTDNLTDSIAVDWQGTGFSADLSTSTGRKIAVVVKLDGLPIPRSLAGKAIAWGEDQSYIFVETSQRLELVTDAPSGNHTLELLTRSDKLVCHQFIVTKD